MIKNIILIVLICLSFYAQLALSDRNHCIDIIEGEIFNIENSEGNASLVEGNIEQNAYYFQESMKQSQSSQKMEFGNSDLSIVFSIKFNVFDYGQDIIFEMLDNQGYSDLELAIYKKQIIMKQFGNVVCQFPELSDIEENNWIHYSISLLKNKEVMIFKNGIAQKCLHSDYIEFKELLVLNRQERVINIGVKRYKDEVQKYLNNAVIEGFKIFDYKLNIQQVLCLQDKCEYQCGDKCYLQSDICSSDQVCQIQQSEQGCSDQYVKNQKCLWDQEKSFCYSDSCEIDQKLIQDLQLKYVQQINNRVQHVQDFQFQLNKFLEDKNSDCYYQGSIKLYNYRKKEFENIDDYSGLFVQSLQIQGDKVKFAIDYDSIVYQYFKQFELYIQFQVKSKNQIVGSWIIAIKHSEVVYIQKEIFDIEKDYEQKEEVYIKQHKQVISNSYEVKIDSLNQFKLEMKNNFMRVFYRAKIMEASLVSEQNGDISDQLLIYDNYSAIIVPKINSLGAYKLKVSGVFEKREGLESPLYEYERYFQQEISVVVVEEIQYHKYYYEYFYSQRPDIYILVFDIFDEDFDFALAAVIMMSMISIVVISFALYRCRSKAGVNQEQEQRQQQNQNNINNNNDLELQLEQNNNNNNNSENDIEIQSVQLKCSQQKDNINSEIKDSNNDNNVVVQSQQAQINQQEYEQQQQQQELQKQEDEVVCKQQKDQSLIQVQIEGQIENKGL